MEKRRAEGRTVAVLEGITQCGANLRAPRTGCVTL